MGAPTPPDSPFRAVHAVRDKLKHAGGLLAFGAVGGGRERVGGGDANDNGNNYNYGKDGGNDNSIERRDKSNDRTIAVNPPPPPSTAPQDSPNRVRGICPPNHMMIGGGDKSNLY